MSEDSGTGKRRNLFSVPFTSYFGQEEFSTKESLPDKGDIGAMGFYTVGRRGTVTRQRFNARGACKRLYEGMKGFGTNEDAITEVIAGHTAAQRMEIKSKYKIMYGKDLLKELDSELSGSFSKLILSLMKDPEEYILECIRNAIVKSRGGKLFKKLQKMTYKKGLCSDAYTLLGLLVLRTNAQLIALKKAYKTKYEAELEDDVGQDFADEFRSLLFGLIYAGREDCGDVDLELLQEDIDLLQDGKATTKEEHFQACLEERSWAHLRELFNSFKDVTGESVEAEVLEKSEVFSDYMKEAFGAVVKIIRNEADFYAERLKDAIDGLGTDDDTLISIVVLRAEIDLVDIIERYEHMYGKSLEDDVMGDTSGDYKNILLKLLTVPDYDGDEGSVAEERARARKRVSVEIQTQTSMVEDYDPAEHQVNVADDDGQETQGHEGKVETEPEEEEEDDYSTVEDEIIVEKKKGETQAAPLAMEDAEEAEAGEEQVDGASDDGVGEVQDEVVVEETIVSVEDAKTEEEDDDKTIMGAVDQEEAAAEDIAEQPTTDINVTISETEADEEDKKKLADDVDNADGG